MHIDSGPIISFHPGAKLDEGGREQGGRLGGHREEVEGRKRGEDNWWREKKERIRVKKASYHTPLVVVSF